MSDLNQLEGRQRLVGIEFKSNWRDLATGKVDADNLVALLTEKRMYRSDTRQKRNDFYNMMALTRDPEKLDIDGAQKDHAMILLRENKIITLPHKLNLEAYAKRNPDMPSWIDLDTGSSFRIDAQGKKRIFDSQIIKGLIGHLENMVLMQCELGAVKFDLSGEKRRAIKERMSGEIHIMNNRFNPFQP
jgi:hypothetical protein